MSVIKIYDNKQRHFFRVSKFKASGKFDQTALVS